MRLFSERIGKKPTKNILQTDSVDMETRYRLWNVLCKVYWQKVTPDSRYLGDYNDMGVLIKRLWDSFFKWPLDNISPNWEETYQKLRDFFLKAEWYEVYDFIEFVANSYPDPDETTNKAFMESCNIILKEEMSAYRFVGNHISRITSNEEIAEIDEALEKSGPLKPISEHLHNALKLLADRNKPDYRNSIKESMSSVEALCNLITGESGTTLGQALKAMKDKVELHPSFEQALSKLYGYTSDADGIRHALLEESHLDFEDAKFMLVSCSAFINFLTEKATKAGIKLRLK